MFLGLVTAKQNNYHTRLSVDMADDAWHYHRGLVPQPIAPDDHLTPLYWSHGDTRPVHSVIWMKMKGVQIAVSELIGQGAFGRVYAVCQANQSSCTLRGEFAWAMKLQPLHDKHTLFEHFAPERDRTQHASDLGFGVKMHAWEVTTVGALPKALQEFPNSERKITADTLVGVLILDRWMSDLLQVRQDWVFANKGSILRRLEQRIDAMQRHSIIHGDLKPANVLVRFSREGEFQDLMLADLGFSFPVSRLRYELPTWTPNRLAYYFSGYVANTSRLPREHKPLVDIATQILNLDVTADYNRIVEWIFTNPIQLDRLILYHYANWR